MGKWRARDGKSYKEMRKIVEKDGWAAVRQTGDHLHFKHPTKKGLVTIPQTSMSKNVELSILRQAGLRQRKEEQ